jgi:uncharacterized protein YcsI (UPF0317 family)
MECTSKYHAHSPHALQVRRTKAAPVVQRFYQTESKTSGAVQGFIDLNVYVLRMDVLYEYEHVCST